jgi:poly(3-hydroxybutyrate) depolymerase
MVGASKGFRATVANMSMARQYAPALAMVLASTLALGCTGTTASSPSRPPSSGLLDPAALGPTCAPARAHGDAPAIDDFEATAGRILGHDGRAGWWFSYDDGTGGQLVRERVALDGSQGPGHVLHAVASGFTQWGAGFGANLHPATTPRNGCPYDASAYSGIRLRARGHGRVRLTLVDRASTPVAQGGTCTQAGDGCFDRAGVWLDLGERWKTYSYPFCGFFPEGWGGSSAGVDPTQLFGFQLRIRAHEKVEIWLDDLAFYRSQAGTAEPRCGRPCPLDEIPSSATIAPARSTVALTNELRLYTFEQPTHSCGMLWRRYLCFVPNRLGPRSAAPVLMMLHGSGSNAESARTLQTRRRFEALAARDGFIVVYGNAAPGPDTRPDPAFPNSGAWRLGSGGGEQVDDVDYLERVLDDLAARGVIAGGNPVLLAGISNGGGMVLEAARRMPDRLTGIAAVMPYVGQQPGRVPDLAHAKLQRVLFAYSKGDPGLPDGYHETLATLAAHWAAAMGVPAAVIGAPQTTALPDLVTEGDEYRGHSPAALATRHSRATRMDMPAPNGDHEVRVLVMDHAGHFWPNPTPDTEEWILDRWGFRNQDFDAADLIWEYLRGALAPRQGRTP